MDRLLARLDHAWGHREKFYTQSQAYTDTQPYRVWSEIEEEWGDILLRVEVTHPIPPTLGFVLADCIHNIRATLDNMVCALPGADPAKATFPIFETAPAEGFVKKPPRRLEGIDPTAISIIESLQPYQQTRMASGLTVDGDQIPVGILLLQLNQLWNRDKHREPALMLSNVSEIQLTLSNQAFVPSKLHQGPFNSGDAIARFEPTALLVEHPETNLQAYLGLDLVFSPDQLTGPTWPSANVAIVSLYNCVREDVLPLFEDFL